MITPFDSNGSDLRQGYGNLNLHSACPLFSICAYRNLCKRTDLWARPEEISTPTGRMSESLLANLGCFGFQPDCES
jgi:hypothetical protein